MSKTKILMAFFACLFMSQAKAQVADTTDDYDPLDSVISLRYDSLHQQYLLSQQNIQIPPFVITESQILKFRNKAQYFVKFANDSLNGFVVRFYNTNNALVKSKTIVGKYLLADLAKESIFTAKLVKGTQEFELVHINTKLEDKTEEITVSPSLMDVFEFDEAFKSRSIDFIQAMDNDSNLTYFEKLKFLQGHLLHGGSLANALALNEYIVLSEAVVHGEVRPSWKTTGGGDILHLEEKQNLTPMDVNRYDLQIEPWHADCNSSLTMNTKQNVSNAYELSDFDIYSYPYNYLKVKPKNELEKSRSTSKYESNIKLDFMGASTETNLSNHGWPNWGNPDPTTEKTNDTSYHNTSTHYQSIIYHLVSTDETDRYSIDCACEKKIYVGAKYYSYLYARTKLLGNANNRDSKAQIADQALFTILENGSYNTMGHGGKIELNQSVSSTYNPDFGNNIGEFAEQSLKIASIIGVGSFKNAAAVLRALDSSGAVGKFLSSGLKTFNTNIKKWDGSNTDGYHNGNLVDTEFIYILKPYRRTAFVISSQQQGQVYGKKHWESRVNIKSKAYLATYVYPTATVTGPYSTNPQQCCSPQFGHWVSTSMTDDGIGYFNSLINGFYVISNITGWESKYKTGYGSDLNILGNIGSIKGNKTPSCKNPIAIDIMSRKSQNNTLTGGGTESELCHIYSQNKTINANVSTDWIGATFSIIAIDGKLISKGMISQAKNTLLDGNALPNGIYMVKIQGKTNSKTFKINLQ